MSRVYSRVAAASLVTAIAAVVIACGDTQQSSPMSPKGRASLTETPVETRGVFKLCKTSEKAGAFTFQLSAVGGGAGVETLPTTFTITLDADMTGLCKNVFFPATPATWTTNMTITATEIVPNGMAVCNVATYNGSSMIGDFPGSPTASVSLAYGQDVSIEYRNCAGPPPPTSKGCTPGYWKQDQHFDSWPSGVTPSQYLKTYFSGTIPLSFGGKSLGNYTMLDGLKMKGGSGVDGAWQILMRAAVAAYLNSKMNFGYQYTTAQVVSMVNTALASNNRDLIVITAGKLDLANNAGCTLK
jgi:hypothetical protein